MRTIPLTATLYLALVAVAVAFYAIAAGFPPAFAPGDVGPSAFPQWIAALLVVLVAVEWAVARGGWRSAPLADLRLAFGAGAYVSAAVVLTGVLGFFVAMPPVLFGGLWLLGERRIGLMAAYSIGFTLFLWGFFSYALDKPLGTFGA
ncbi:MAG: tripartite tricarboxylate transporter TctB family protein [Alphaproteobacteria bacterium]